MTSRITKAQLADQLAAARADVSRLQTQLIAERALHQRQLDALSTQVVELREACKYHESARDTHVALAIDEAQTQSRLMRHPEQRRRAVHMLVLNGVEHFASWDYAWLSKIARNTKQAHSDYAVSIHRLH